MKANGRGGATLSPNYRMPSEGGGRAEPVQSSSSCPLPWSARPACRWLTCRDIRSQPACADCLLESSDGKAVVWGRDRARYLGRYRQLGRRRSLVVRAMRRAAGTAPAAQTVLPVGLRPRAGRSLGRVLGLREVFVPDLLHDLVRDVGERLADGKAVLRWQNAVEPVPLVPPARRI